MKRIFVCLAICFVVWMGCSSVHSIKQTTKNTKNIFSYFPEKYSRRDWYIHLHKTIARSVAKLQGEDGFCRSSLLDPDKFPDPEISGTAFYCYAIAWGINNGYLDRDKYLPVVMKAWKGLVGAVHSDGIAEAWAQITSGAATPEDLSSFRSQIGKDAIVIGLWHPSSGDSAEIIFGARIS